MNERHSVTPVWLRRLTGLKRTDGEWPVPQPIIMETKQNYVRVDRYVEYGLGLDELGQCNYQCLLTVVYMSFSAFSSVLTALSRDELHSSTLWSYHVCYIGSS